MTRTPGRSLSLCVLLAACGSDPAIGSGPEQESRDKAGEQKERDAGMRDAAPAERMDAMVRPPSSNNNGNRSDGGGCDTALEITIRDFTEAHPDFESFTFALKGIVEQDLGADRKPVYAHAGGTGATTGPAEFDQWYNDTPGVNERFSHRLEFTDQGNGVYVYDSSAFFPIDDMGFGNGPDSQGIDIPIIGPIGGGKAEHNFLFTTEAHTMFLYRGGETFRFSGDDDMWVFLNGKLAIDLGGTHSETSASVELDAEATRLGLEKGKKYAMDIFHAERHTNESNYHIETTIDLSCIENVEVPFI